MFQQTFVEVGPNTSKPYAVFVSTALQAAGICILILVPLLYAQVLPNAQLRSLLITPPPPASTPKPPVVKERATVRTLRSMQLGKLTAPAAIPKRIVINDQLAPAPDVGPASDVIGTPEAGSPVLFGSSTAAPLPPAPAVPIAKPKPAGPLRVGGVVEEANLLHRVTPVYPALAKSARVQGTVEFSAVISKEGRVEKLELVRGHPLLVNAAREAILEWRYRPTMLNGGPVEVMTTIVVNFNLAQ